MYWDFEEESVVKEPKRAPPMHAREVISAFGCTDTVGSSSAPGSPAPRFEVERAFAKFEQHQQMLPLLPIPDIKDTCDLYLQSLAGILNAEEYDRSKSYVDDFLSSGDADRLQEMLVKRYNNKDCGSSWIEDFWDDMYLRGRDPIPINVNYFFVFENHHRDECMTQVGRAASLLRGAADFYTQVRDGKLSMDKERGVPLCMSQYRRVFCASRVPGEDRDTIVMYNETPLSFDELHSHTCVVEPVSVRHCVVLMRNRMFVLNVLDETGSPTSINDIMEKVAYVTLVTSEGCGAPIGLFTTMDRGEWFNARSQLVELSTENERNLILIQTAIIVVCLDGVHCENRSEAARMVLHGTGTNRWFDRHNLIVSKNGWAGINFEHSVGDGATTIRVADAMYRDDVQCPSKAEVDAVIESVAHRMAKKNFSIVSEVQELTWTVDGSLDHKLKTAFDSFIQLIEANETSTVHFPHFGGDYIKKLKLSPDGFVQVAFQLTYFKVFGRLDATYESASTRQFLHGRTEVVRGATRSAADFCQTTGQCIFSRRPNSKIPTQYEMLKDAVQTHVEYMKRAKAGLGVDRHLFGLKLMCAINNFPLPMMFKDPAFARSCHWNLSTSHCGSSALSLFGFGPVVNDGLGLGYMIKNSSIEVVVTSKYTHKLTSSQIFGCMLEASLLQMKAICESTAQRASHRPVAQEFVHPAMAMSDYQFDPHRGFTYKGTKKKLYEPALKSPSNKREASASLLTPPREGDLKVVLNTSSDPKRDE